MRWFQRVLTKWPRPTSTYTQIGLTSSPPQPSHSYNQFFLFSSVASIWFGLAVADKSRSSCTISGISVSEHNHVYAYAGTVICNASGVAQIIITFSSTSNLKRIYSVAHIYVWLQLRGAYCEWVVRDDAARRRCWTTIIIAAAAVAATLFILHSCRPMCAQTCNYQLW